MICARLPLLNWYYKTSRAKMAPTMVDRYDLIHMAELWPHSGQYCQQTLLTVTQTDDMDYFSNLHIWESLLVSQTEGFQLIEITFPVCYFSCLIMSLSYLCWPVKYQFSFLANRRVSFVNILFDKGMGITSSLTILESSQFWWSVNTWHEANCQLRH